MNKKFLDKSRAVQERWYRMQFHKKFGRQLQSVFLWYLHLKLSREFRAQDKAINGAIETTVKEMKKIDKELFPATEKFMNIGLYFLLAERDIQAVKADAISHPNKTKRSIALRTLLLTVYEWNMSKVTGSKMGYIYEVTELSDERKNELVSALKELNKARKLIDSQFSEVRHNAIAHREPNAMIQYKIIAELNLNQVSSALTVFYAASGRLLKALTAALIEISQTRNMIHQVVNGKKAAPKYGIKL